MINLLAGIRGLISNTRSLLFKLASRIREATIFRVTPNRSTYVKRQNIEQLRPYQLDEYIEKARSILVKTARSQTLITYDTLMYKLNLGPGRKVCGEIVRKVSEVELSAGRPKLSAVVVRSDTRMVGGGFFGLPNTPESVKRSKWEEWHDPIINLEAQEYWHDELRRVYEYWSKKSTNGANGSSFP